MTGICQPGYYWKLNTVKYNQYPWSAGSYNDDYGITDQPQWKDWPKGAFCPSASTTPILCPSGTYNNIINQGTVASWLSWSSGSYCPLGSQS